MTNRDFYLAKLPLLNAIAPRAVRYPTMAVQVYLQEAENLYLWVQEDEQALRDAGLDWEVVTDFAPRMGALRYAESIAQNLRAKPRERVRERNRLLKQGRELRDALKRGFKLMFRQQRDMDAFLNHISRSQASAEVIQDLSNLQLLIREHGLPPLAGSHDSSPAGDPSDLARRLAALAVSKEMERQELGKAYDLRNRAFTHLKEAVDEVREWGKHRFFGNPDRLKGYASPHFRRANAKARAAAKKSGAANEAQPRPPSEPGPPRSASTVNPPVDLSRDNQKHP